VSPLCVNHCLLPLFSAKGLPQVIDSDSVALVLKVFNMSNSETLRIGYNSIGAYSSVNHLHFQLFYADDLFTIGKFPIELAEKKEFFRSNLQNIKDEINTYSVGIIIKELPDYPAKTIVIQPMDTNTDIGKIYSSLSFAAGAITNILLENNIPHNILMSEKGCCIYIVPRKYEKDRQDDNMNCSLFEISGLAVCKNKDFYDNLTKEEYEKILKAEASLNDYDFTELKTKIEKFFKSAYK